MKWSKDFHAIGKHGEYMVTQRGPYDYKLYYRNHGEQAYRPVGGGYRSTTQAKAAAGLHEEDLRSVA